MDMKMSNIYLLRITWLKIFVICLVTKVNHSSPVSWLMMPDQDNCGEQAVEDLANIQTNRDFPDYESGRVIGGSVSKYGAHPWQIQIVSTKTRDDYQCSGAIISPLFVVTAAHCLAQRNINNYKIKVGDYNKGILDEYEDDFDIDDVTIHEHFQKGTVYDNDIAVVKIKQKNGQGFNFNANYVHPVCLPSIFTPFYPDENCLVSGWGQVNAFNHTSLSDVLHHASVPIISHNTCKDLYQRHTEVKDGMLCAGYIQGGVDACKGDSGGPLVCLIHGKFVLFGLVSWGDGCAVQQRPGVYTRIQHYSNWIRTKIVKMKQATL